MRTIAGGLSLLLVVACAKADKPAADAPASPPAATAGISLQDLAGTWSMKTMAEGSDSVLVAYQLTATGTESGWTLNFPGRDPLPMRVLAVAGDSVVTESGPYESVLRKGVQVTTRTVMRLSHGALAGTTVASYSTGEELRLRTVGLRP
jgi:hypothetical protein